MTLTVHSLHYLNQGSLRRQSDEAQAVDRARDGRHGRGEGLGGGGRVGQGHRRAREAAREEGRRGTPDGGAGEGGGQAEDVRLESRLIGLRSRETYF